MTTGDTASMEHGQVAVLGWRLVTERLHCHLEVQQQQATRCPIAPAARQYIAPQRGRATLRLSSVLCLGSTAQPKRTLLHADIEAGSMVVTASVHMHEQ